MVFPARNGPGAEDVTWRHFAQATHRIAHVLRPGRAGSEGEVVAVLAHCDSVLYNALLAGIIRAGYIVSLSIRNCVSPRLIPISL